MGRTLRFIRILYGLTLKELATRMGVSSAYLSSIEQGAKNVTFKILDAYGYHFNLKASAIMRMNENIMGLPQEEIAGEIFDILAI